MTQWIFLVVVVLLIFLLNHYYPYFFKAFRLTLLRGRWTAAPYDLYDFESRTIASGKGTSWERGGFYGKLEMSNGFASEVSRLKTSALLVAQSGELVHEEYFGSHQRETLSNSFSMAKTIVALMTGKAIEDGYIRDLDQKVSDFISGYDYPPADELSIRDLLRMSSGMNWKENYYLPFNETTEAYYGNQLQELILSRKIVDKPGQTFNYQSGNTQLLGIILNKVLPVSLSEYLSRSFWKPMGMEHEAYWTIDKASEVEKTYCCIHATARDFLKFGQLLLQNGRWNDAQLISSEFLEDMRNVGFRDSPQYGSGVWLDNTYDPKFYLMRGHLGQYVIVIPSREVVICRLGHRYMKDGNPPRLQLDDIYMYVEGVLEMLRLKD